MRVQHYPLINYLTNDKGYLVAKRLKQELDIFGIQYNSDHYDEDDYLEFENATVFRSNSQN